MSGWVRRASSPATLGQDAADTVAAAREGQVATLIVPQDATWGEDAKPASAASASPRKRVSNAKIEKIAAAIANDDTAILLVNGNGLSERGLGAANRISAKTGCRLMVEVFAARMARGAGRGGVDDGGVPGASPATNGWLSEHAPRLRLNCHSQPRSGHGRSQALVMPGA